MLTHQELLEIVEPLKRLSDLQVFKKLDELGLPPGARDRVLSELEKQRQVDILNRAMNDGLVVPAGASLDEMIDAALGITRRKA